MARGIKTGMSWLPWGMAITLASMPLCAQANESGLSGAQEKVLAPCMACHDLTPLRQKLAGPPLFRIYGSKPIGAGIPFARWDREALNKWLLDPSQVMPDTFMDFQVKDDQTRAAIIQALEALK